MQCHDVSVTDAKVITLCNHVLINWQSVGHPLSLTMAHLSRSESRILDLSRCSCRLGKVDMASCKPLVCQLVFKELSQLSFCQNKI